MKISQILAFTCTKYSRKNSQHHHHGPFFKLSTHTTSLLKLVVLQYNPGSNKSYLIFTKRTLKQECIPVGCALPAVHCMIGSPPPGQRLPGRNMGPETETPQKEHGTGLPDRKWHHPGSSLWTEWLIHACENITLPQISFAVGNCDI